VTDGAAEAAVGLDGEPDPVAQLAAAMSALNALERLMFGRLIRRCVRVPKYRWVQAVNAIGIAGTTRAVVASRWGFIVFVSGLATFGFLGQSGTAAKTTGIIAGAVCAVALGSYLARLGETLQILQLRRRR